MIGNYVGISADGDMGSGLGNEVGVYVEGGHDNLVGGQRPGLRNVIAGNAQGVCFGAAGRNNRVEGNLFGMDPSGTTVIPQGAGIALLEAIERQIIGGDSPEAGNYFATAAGDGIYVRNSTPASLVLSNTFGRGPTGVDLGIDTGVKCTNSSPRLADNLFVGATRGVVSKGAIARPTLVGNEFRGCATGVLIRNDARPCLGNLHNTSTTDDGENLFRRDNRQHIANRSPQKIWAENNNFFTTVRARISARIIDQADDPSYGVVDFSPLLGGAIPTGTGTEAAALGVVAACTPMAAGGAEITLTLSAEGSVSVEVLNIAGRPVRTLCRERPATRGVNRLAWDGRADTGLTVPTGVYVVRATARADEGAQASSVATVSLRR